MLKLIPNYDCFKGRNQVDLEQRGLKISQLNISPNDYEEMILNQTYLDSR